MWNTIFSLKSRIVGAAAFVLLLSTAASAQDAKEKAIVKVGWDGTTPAKMLENLETMKQMPLDGYTFRFQWLPRPSGRAMPLQNIFTLEPLDDELFEIHREPMRELARRDLGKLTDNLVMIWCTGTDGWDWFNDDHWNAVNENWRRLAELASLSGSNILLDPESYYTHVDPDLFWVFNYQDNPRADDKSFAEYEEVVRERGREFVQTLRDVDPDIDILSMYGMNTMSDEVLATTNEADRLEALEAQTFYNLLPAFLLGVLEEAHDGFEFHDGNERSYYYTTDEQFADSRLRMKRGLKSVVPPELHDEFDEHYRAGHAVYASDLYPADPESTPYRAFFRLELPRDRAAELVAHNVYHGLKQSDKYLWIYTENDIDFWTGDVPPGMAEAIERGASMYRSGESFPEGIEEEVVAARQRHQEKATGGLARGTGTLVNLGTPPTIDGRGDDAAWQNLEQHGPFHETVQETGGTTDNDAFVKFAADGDFLYVLVEAQDDLSPDLDSRGTERDDDVWAGDDVEVLVRDPNQSDVAYLLMVNPAGLRYDARLTFGDDSAIDFDTNDYDPKWQAKTHVGEGVWSVELAIPWSAIGGRPRNDQPLRLNVARSFGERGGPGFITWSQVIEGFLSPDQVGELRAAGN
jgi:hypothetical protein